MEKSKKTRTTLADSQRSSASDHTLRTGDFHWVKNTASNTDHVYFNEEWNGEYEN